MYAAASTTTALPTAMRVLLAQGFIGFAAFGWLADRDAPRSIVRALTHCRQQ